MEYSFNFNPNADMNQRQVLLSNIAARGIKETVQEFRTIINSSIRRVVPRKGVDGRIILEWILGKYGGRMWIGFIWPQSRYGCGGKGKVVPVLLLSTAP
jgi:hypothetical protein